MSRTPENGVVSFTSPRGVDETVRRLVRALDRQGMSIFARIDQQAAAKAVGVDMAAMVLVLFGDPRTGTLLMTAYPSLAIDLPLKVLVWEDTSHRVWVSYNSPEYLRQRHGMSETPFRRLDALLAEATDERSE